VTILTNTERTSQMSKTTRTSPHTTKQTKPKLELVAIDKIVIGKRARTKKHCGNIKAFSEAMAKLAIGGFNGQLQPIVLNSRYELIAGYRRLLALKKSGQTHVWAIRFKQLDDPLLALQAERDENVQREMMWSADLLKVIERMMKIERKQSADRQKATRATKGHKIGTQGDGKLPSRSAAEHGTTRDKVGAEVGKSGRTVDKAMKVNEAAKANPGRYGDLAARLKANGKVDPVYKEMRTRKAADDAALIPDDPEIPRPRLRSSRPGPRRRCGATPRRG
jgi:ParB family chromosome partitioning protein